MGEASSSPPKTSLCTCSIQTHSSYAFCSVKRSNMHARACYAYQPCWFKPEAPDYGIYPKAREAKCLSVTLNPGELLIQPSGWFHQVYALNSPNMSVSYFWRY